MPIILLDLIRVYESGTLYFDRAENTFWALFSTPYYGEDVENETATFCIEKASDLMRFVYEYEIDLRKPQIDNETARIWA